MNKKRLYIIGTVSLVLLVVIVFARGSSDSASSVTVPVEKGDFVIDIMTSGALEAKNSVKISGPTGLRNYRIWNVTIQDIIDEGTYVKKGQYVAKLDPSELTGKIKDSELEVEQRNGHEILRMRFGRWVVWTDLSIFCPPTLTPLSIC